MDGARHEQAVAMLTSLERYMRLVCEREVVVPRGCPRPSPSPCTQQLRQASVHQPLPAWQHSRTIKKKNQINNLPNGIEFPEAPTTLGKVTETITKSTLTETVVTRVTDNQLVAPVIIEVSSSVEQNQHIVCLSLLFRLLHGNH
ncbi:uncharacterized protein LOC124373597 [Homalodisca vitripennis]|uniref:uncharacterized protein LOC124373597 n=1 Tax=Homalodisca vitripennis TaxID=197043 RepID=UPI001EEA2797|nr:uncharacterized protein LOC124373597 [Homalodisca vitripennis]